MENEKSRKAEFKARREALGIPQAHLAELLGVNLLSVKRWEKPEFREPPQDAWDIIEEAEARQQQIVAFALEKAKERTWVAGKKPKEIFLTYFRSQAEYDKHGRDKGQYTMVNATTRLVAAILKREGYKVTFVYPQEWPCERP